MMIKLKFLMNGSTLCYSQPTLTLNHLPIPPT